MIEYEKLFLDDELCRIISWDLNDKYNKVIILKDALYYINEADLTYIKNKEIHQVSLYFNSNIRCCVFIYCDAGHRIEIDFSGDFDGKKLAEEAFVEIINLYNRAFK